LNDYRIDTTSHFHPSQHVDQDVSRGLHLENTNSLIDTLSNIHFSPTHSPLQLDINNRHNNPGVTDNIPPEVTDIIMEMEEQPGKNEHLHQVDFNQNPCCDYEDDNTDQSMDFDIDFPFIRDFDIPSIQPTDWTAYEQMNTPPDVSTQQHQEPKLNFEIQKNAANPKEEFRTEKHDVEFMNTLNKTMSDSEKIMTEGDEDVPSEIFDKNGDT